jgi:hypothetical protein
MGKNTTLEHENAQIKNHIATGSRSPFQAAARHPTHPSQSPKDHTTDL